MTSGKTPSGKTILHHIKFENLVGGMAGGIVSTAALHPLDLVKVRFQVDEGIGITNRPKYTGLWHAFKTIFKTSGPLGLYQGAVPNITGAGAAWGFYFLL
ncbi:mitochondrial folate transporter/carrier [Lingula anatina]|uniref:Mitochondrial folate transporter/carrier n=1 Tax=Lingula anatina TaxID=7574 RepID=A0A1S3JB09_LINAN|nr:mitochondrial folate transporter/carrier [Lingula anatina]|eukprot:XP_013407513.1 mitochondrial folate transporter/carrier [Lingula anatina]